MSHTTDQLATTETQDAPGYDASAPPPSNSYQDQQPPPYSEAPIIETSPLNEPMTKYESFQDIIPEAPSYPTPVSSSFDDKAVRRGFVRKVFCIVTLQLLFTFSVVCVFTFSSVVKDAVQKNLWAYISSIIIFAVVAIALNCCKSFSRRHPWNIMGLVVVTLSMSYMVGTAASFHNTAAVVITMGVTLVISVTIIAFSVQTRYDFTICYGVLLILVVDLAMFGIICSFYYTYIAEVAYGCLGALLFSLVTEKRTVFSWIIKNNIKTICWDVQTRILKHVPVAMSKERNQIQIQTLTERFHFNLCYFSMTFRLNDVKKIKFRIL